MTTSASVCVFPLSPTYLPLHRYLYYTSLIISVLYPTPPPLVKGAFAFSLTYSSTAALHAFLVAGVSAYEYAVNLDIFGLWAILSPASIVVLPLLQWNKNLKVSASNSARPIIRIWGVLVIAATICVYVLVMNAKDIAEGLGSLGEGVETCLHSLETLKKPKILLRNPEDVLSAAYEPVFGRVYQWIILRISGLVFLPMAFGLITCLITIIHDTHIYQEDRSPLGDFPTLPTGTPFTFYSAMRNGFVHLRSVVLCLTPLLLIPTMVINEFYLLNGRRDGLLEGEKMYEVGQWGICVGAGLVGAAALVNSIAGQVQRKETVVTYLGDSVA